MKTLNLGILAHVDAGKTSLTERLLFEGGAIKRVGSVDAGTTHTDTLALERRRGITIKSAVASFRVRDTTVNIIDTPGHPDFVAEVERVLDVLDGAVMVISAVEGVQANTRVLMRALQRLRVPTLIFVNKVDRTGAQQESLLRSIADRLTPDIVPMDSVVGAGTRSASVRGRLPADPAHAKRVLDALAFHDDSVTAAYLEDDGVGEAELMAALERQTRAARMHPVYFGSAITGAGVDLLVDGLVRFLPAASTDTRRLSGRIFKIDRGPAGEKLAYVRMFSGSLHVRGRIQLPAGSAVVTAIEEFDASGVAKVDRLEAGRIGRVTGLTPARIGDDIGSDAATAVARHHFSRPTLETVVTPVEPGERTALFTALSRVAEQDPLIDLRLDDRREQLAVSLYGEVQKQVIESTLADDYGLAVRFSDTTPICIERVVGTGASVEIIGTDSNPFLATVGLRVEPATTPDEHGFHLGVELGSMPAAFFTAVEDTVRTALGEGLNGWQVTNASVTMTHSGYYPRQSHMGAKFDKSMSSTAGDFRLLTPLVLMAALREAGTVVCEPVLRFRLEVPLDLTGAAVSVLPSVGAIPLTTTTERGSGIVAGEVPAARVRQVERLVPSLSRGEGLIESTFDHYRPVPGAAPARPRSDHNPLDRKEYLLHTVRRV